MAFSWLMVKRFWRSQFWRMKRWGGAIARSEWFPNKLPCILKGKFEGGKTGLSPIVTAVRSHFP
ncbi:hypothetical protein [Cylindrospermopsis raciborskii]|uniref:hypothetical protein n=1 Tax=Cylindrospermopsis raciborskii TaxID=77022 RepID=UPI0022BAA732|nr:hypothetical protein [Cylindrospermopsis raciborskii]MCZ2207747.1 hypothetical protein [Cylindrospermopsis raciborskii PAMP2011]